MWLMVAKTCLQGLEFSIVATNPKVPKETSSSRRKEKVGDIETLEPLWTFAFGLIS